MNKTSIEWTDRTWNPIHARRKSDGKVGNFCTRISPGCTHCYASSINKRFGNGYDYAVPNLENVEFFLDRKELQAPLKLKQPSKIFVGDMFDLFHEAISDEMLLDVWDVMEQAGQHTFQVLTKRAHRMRSFISSLSRYHFALEGQGIIVPNVWLGVSVEDQHRADERIPLLLETPAAVRWLSVEPLLEEVQLKWKWLTQPGICWAVVGGESGIGARPFDLRWAEVLLQQCSAMGVPFFMKQIGSKPQIGGSDYLGQFDGYRRHETESKGGNMEAWPPELRVREFPVVQ